MPLFLSPFPRERGRKEGQDDHRCGQVVVEQKHLFGRAHGLVFFAELPSEPGGTQVPRRSNALACFNACPFPSCLPGPRFRGGSVHRVVSLDMRQVLAGVDHPCPGWQKAGAGLHLPRLFPAEEDAQGLFFFHGCTFLPEKRCSEGRNAKLKLSVVYG